MKGKDGESLEAFINEWVINMFLWNSVAKEYYNGDQVYLRKHCFVPQNTTKNHFPWQNPCDFQILMHMKWACSINQEYFVLKLMWGYMTSYVSRLQRCTVEDEWEKAGLKQILRDNPDISDYVDFQYL